jgi:hypothetical protein
MYENNISRFAAQALASPRLLGDNSALKRITKQVSQAKRNGSFDVAAKQARELAVLPRGLREYAVSRGAVDSMLKSHREESQKMAARRRAIEEATIDTSTAIQALVELEVAGRAEGRRSEEMFIRLAAASLLVSVVGFAVNVLR